MATNPILITGCARSGTSLVAGIFNICGAFGGEISGPTIYNKKGIFENAFIREMLVKPWLENVGADPMGQSPLPDREYDIDIDINWKRQVMKEFEKEGYKDLMATQSEPLNLGNDGEGRNWWSVAYELTYEDSA